jgi:hypothetical protein
MFDRSSCVPCREPGRSLRLTEEALEAPDPLSLPAMRANSRMSSNKCRGPRKSEEVSLADLPEEIRLPAKRPVCRSENAGASSPTSSTTRWWGGHFHFGTTESAPLFLSRDSDAPRSASAPSSWVDDDARQLPGAPSAFGVPESDYKRFMNFLAAHDCIVDFREFRSASADQEAVRPPAGPPPRSARAAVRSRSAEPAA